MAMSALIDRFAREAERSDARVHRDLAWAQIATLALELAGEAGRIAVAPAATVPAELLERLGARAFIPAEAGAASATADVAVGIVRARVAVAETGSVLLVEETLADRAVSMLSRTLIALVAPGDLHPDLFALRALLAPASGRAPAYAALVTGPSRTADIERSLTIGVQGPSAVHVVLLR
ncbi:MAG: hypothetical protein EXR65_03780 [Dehalococcoidia bacterium]|nr:hypothetical protein [Dehalococcoidia bacterium]